MRLLCLVLLALAALLAAETTSFADAAQNSTDVDAASSSMPTKSANNATAVPVTIDDYVRAETDETFKRCGPGKMESEREKKRERQRLAESSWIPLPIDLAAPLLVSPRTLSLTLSLSLYSLFHSPSLFFPFYFFLRPPSRKGPVTLV